VHSFFLHKKKILLSSKNTDGSGLLVQLDMNKGKEINKVQTTSVQNYFIFSNNLLLTKDSRNNAILLNDSLDIIDIMPESIKVGDSSLINNHIVIYTGKLKNKKFGIYSLIQKKEIWVNSELNALEIYGDNVFGQTDFVFCRLELISGELIWEIDLKKIFPDLKLSGRVKILVVCNNIILLGIINVDKLVAINFITGKVLWDLTSNIRGKLVHDKIIHSFLINYNQISLLNGKVIKSFIDKEYFEKAGIKSQRDNYILIDSHIITTDFSKGIIGAFNINTCEFDWTYEMKGGNFPLPKPIKYCAPYLFIQDNLGALHIFQKQTL
jgi:hypothetical protein